MGDKKRRSQQGHGTIETTIGELICAIADAAREITIDEEELRRLTEETLNTMLERRIA